MPRSLKLLLYEESFAVVFSQAAKGESTARPASFPTRFRLGPAA
jgi:hypothetical protein